MADDDAPTPDEPAADAADLESELARLREENARLEQELNGSSGDGTAAPPRARPSSPPCTAIACAPYSHRWTAFSLPSERRG